MTTATSLAATAGAGLARRGLATVLAIAHAVRWWYRRDRDLRHVMQLDDHLLRDIGLTREQVMRGTFPLHEGCQPPRWKRHR
jgi:uncharacterized protein YjiS (DUF1127 family)